MPGFWRLAGSPLKISMNCLSSVVGYNLGEVAGYLLPRLRSSRSGMAAVPCCIVLLLLAPSIAASSASSLCSQQVNEPARDQRYAVMSTVLKRGFLFVQVDVAKVVIRFGERTAEVLRQAVQGRAPSEQLDDRVAEAAMDSRDALVELTFERDITLTRFIDEARRSTERVWKAGVINRKAYERIRQLLPFWYGSLRGRGIKKDDRMCYQIRGDELRTVYVGRDGKVFLNQVNEGDSSCLAVLGGYFVKGSDFRKGLIDSLFRPGASDSPETRTH